MKQFVGWALVGSAIMGVFGVAFDAGSTTDIADGFYYIAGVGLYVFGIWAAVLLLKK